jgi:hypothetical protein
MSDSDEHADVLVQIVLVNQILYYCYFASRNIVFVEEFQYSVHIHDVRSSHCTISQGYRPTPSTNLPAPQPKSDAHGSSYAPS